MITEVKRNENAVNDLGFVEVLQMYEKGLISSETVLKRCGFDPEEEKKKKDKDKDKDKDKVKDTSGAGRNYNQINSEDQLKLQKIESARRNVEVLSKVLNIGGYSDKSKDKILSVMDNSLDIMNTISK